MKCRITNKKTHFIHSFGKMPIANNFLDRKDNFNKEFFFNLGISFSEDISLLQSDIINNYSPWKIIS